MYDTVECPYCGHENDMSDALVDGCPSDNKMDWECQNCEEEFEVEIEFEPSYTASKIEYVDCAICGKNTRDIYRYGRVYPWPEKFKGKDICEKCFFDGIREEMSNS